MWYFQPQPQTFQQELEGLLGIKFQLKINDNRSTMLSIKWEPEGPKISLHRMFLQAPRNIMEDLACYIKKQNAKLAPTLKAYIQNELPKLDYSHHLDSRKLETIGGVYNLQSIYNRLNRVYFGRQLDLSITWYGRSQHRSRSKLTFGLYSDPLKLIKIHRILDRPLFPDYFVSYVVYHEMVHCLCPPYVDEKGITHIHGPEFKKMERLFVDYDRAQKWLREHQRELFYLRK